MKLLQLLMSDDRGELARSVDADHDTRLRRLEEENAKLREVLRVVVTALVERGIVDNYAGEISAREPDRSVPVARGAKFACSRCETLLAESELARVEGKFVCAECNVEPEAGPINEGSYR
jgi:formylmethanofuran dehydrogenase subunit E